MDKNILCLSWFNGQVKALAVQNGVVQKTWERPGIAEDLSNFVQVLKEAVAATSYDGSDVAIVLSHPRLTHQLVETPPLRGWNLKNFLDRQARQLKTFTSDPVMSYQPALPTKNAKAVLLHLFPKPFLDQLVTACEQADLRLKKVIPATAILNNQLRELPLGDNEVALLAAETGGTTTAVIGRKNGGIYIGRTLNSSWNVYPDRVNVDLNRTLLYVKQQFGAPVDSLWLFGDGAGNHADAMRNLIKTPIQISPIAYNPFYWCEQTARIPFGDTNNLISSEQQQAPKRRVMIRVTAIIIAVLAISSLGVAAAFHVLASDRVKTYQSLQPRVEKLQTRQEQLLQREKDLDQQKRFVTQISDEAVPAVPGWFLGYLGDAVPDELFLNRLQFKRENDLWVFEMTGTLQPITNQPPSALAEAVSRLTNNLVSGPFHARITRNSQEEPDRSAAPVKSPGLLPPGQQASLDKTQFAIEGVMK
jgi:hypothetical protein